MTFMQDARSRWAKAKPLVTGLVIGLVVGPFLSNYLGWQVTSSSARSQLRAAVIDTQAIACNLRARAEVADPSKLDWTARSDLAKKWAVMPGATSADSEVVSACSSKLAA
jgi:hypothetical protein